MSIMQKGFIAPLLLALIAVLILGGGAYVYTQTKQAEKPATMSPTTPTTTVTSPSETVTASLDAQILAAVNKALAGSAIGGYQQIPKGSKLLSAKVAISGSAVTVTLDFNKAIMADGEASFEDTIRLVDNTVYSIVQGESKDPKYSGGMNYVTLIEGKSR